MVEEKGGVGGKGEQEPRSHMICDKMGLGRITKAQSFILYDVYGVFGFKNRLCFNQGEGWGGGGGGKLGIGSNIPPPKPFISSCCPTPPPLLAITSVTIWIGGNRVMDP